MTHAWPTAFTAMLRAPAGRAAPARADEERTSPALGRVLRRALALAAVLCVLASCAGPEPVIPRLEPQPGGIVWPSPPETPRYAYAGTLIGEVNFLPPEADEPDTVISVFSWIAGIVIGESQRLELRRPVSGLVDEQGRVFVVDASERAIFVFDLPGKQFLKWQEAAPGVGFAGPVGISSGMPGEVLVTDAELGEVFRLDRDGKPMARFGKGTLSRPTGIARDPASGKIYVADTAAHDLKVFSADGDLIDTIGTRGSEPGLFNAPTHLVFSGDRLYVTDTLNFRVQAFDRQGDGRLSFGRLGLYVGNLTRPKGVAIGRDGRIYVVESYYDHLLVFSPRGELLLPIGGTGQGVGQFYLPAGVWTDREGRVYVADMFNGRVAVFQELTMGGDL